MEYSEDTRVQTTVAVNKCIKGIYGKGYTVSFDYKAEDMPSDKKYMLPVSADIKYNRCYIGHIRFYNSQFSVLYPFKSVDKRISYLIEKISDKLDILKPSIDDINSKFPSIWNKLIRLRIQYTFYIDLEGMNEEVYSSVCKSVYLLSNYGTEFTLYLMQKISWFHRRLATLKKVSYAGENYLYIKSLTIYRVFRAGIKEEIVDEIKQSVIAKAQLLS